MIRSFNEGVESLTEKLRRLNLPTETRDLNIAHVAEESCRIVALLGFYPQRLVGLDYIERFTPTLEQRLVVAGARLAGLINRAFR